MSERYASPPTSSRRPLPQKPLAELTDAELAAELTERRRLRGAPLITGFTKQYASLELADGATLAEVESAYERLRAKYEPFVNGGDAHRSQAAKQLLDGLRGAYDALRAALSRG
jgi:DnaJ-class molecular chaperone